MPVLHCVHRTFVFLCNSTMEGGYLPLKEITHYFDFWRHAKEECVSVNAAGQCFASLKESYEDYKSIPLTEFSTSLSSLFTGQGVDYPLNKIQEQNILDKLATTTVKGKLMEEIFVASLQYWTRKPAAPLKAFIIVDVQNDFIRGSLRLDQCPAKEDGEEIVPVLNKLIQDGSFGILAYTFDWHPANHCSYFSNVRNQALAEGINVDELKIFDKVTFTKPVEMDQVLWPDHCLQNGWGAELHQDLRKPDLSNDIIVYKGTSAEVDSYSAFWDNGKLGQTDLYRKFLEKGVTDVYLGGLAFDFCVAYSAEDAALLGFRTFVVDDACRAVDLKSKEETIEKYKRLGIQLLQSSDVVVK